MLAYIKARIATFAKSEEGASAIEYGLIAGLIAAVVIVVLTGLGGELGDTFQNILDSLTASNPS